MLKVIFKFQEDIKNAAAELAQINERDKWYNNDIEATTQSRLVSGTPCDSGQVK